MNRVNNGGMNFRVYDNGAQMRAVYREIRYRRDFPNGKPETQKRSIEVSAIEMAIASDRAGDPADPVPPPPAGSKQWRKIPVPPADGLPDPNVYSPHEGAKIKIDEIAYIVSEVYGIYRADIFSDRRTAPVAMARHVVAALAQELTRQSLPFIGKHIGGRDHTTIINSIRRVKARREIDPDFDRMFRQLGAFCQEYARRKAELAVEMARAYAQNGNGETVARPPGVDASAV